MNKQSRVVFYGLILSMWLPSLTAVAQRGSLIEDLFRTVAEAQMQKERQKQLERTKAKRKPAPPTSSQPRSPQPVGEISVGSQEMATFAKILSSFTREIGFLIADLQPHARANPQIRPILPGVYEVSSQASALLRSCDGQSRFDPIINRYSAFDSHWRTLSFQLKSAPSLTPEMQSHVQACDGFVSSMCNQIGVPPQMDRHALHDKMVIAATYMQALLDDFDASDLPSRTLHQWAHDGRLLRQELLRTADEAELISYEEVTARFSEFVSHWGQYSGPIGKVGNPHFNQRLDRIAQCGEETYALLWMQPPASVLDVTATVSSLKKASSQLMDQLTLRALASLDRTSRDLLDRGTRAMYDEAKHLEDAVRRGSNADELRDHFIEFDRAWLPVRDITRDISRVSGSLVADIDRNCATMRRALRIESTGPAPLRTKELIGIAASLEGSAEYLKADIQRYQQYLTPSGFRRSIIRAADDFHDASKRVHAGLFDQADLRSLSRNADKLVDAWQRLSKDMATLRSHGLTGRRVSGLENASRDIAPLVAKVGAALLQ